MKQESPRGKNLKLATFFVLGVIIIITISFFWKLSVLIAHSKYDGKHQFVLEVESIPDKLVCFSPENNSVNILTIKGASDIKNIGKEVSVPIDAHLTLEKPAESIATVLSYSIFHFKKDADIDIIDKIKLWWFIKSAHSDTITTNTVNIPIPDETYINTVQKMFIDKTLYQEAKTIQVINATGMSGYGSRLARLLTNIGGDVVMVTTAQEAENTSSLQYNNALYTNKRIEDILNVTGIFSAKKSAIADIIITIGKDKIDTTLF